MPLHSEVCNHCTNTNPFHDPNIPDPYLKFPISSDLDTKLELELNKLHNYDIEFMREFLQ